MRRAALTLLALVLFSRDAPAAGSRPFVPPAARDRCPVCGMFVGKFPEWWAQVVLADGRRLTFDGVKDLVRFLGDPRRFTPGQPAEVVNIWVHDYYSVAPLPAEEAWYVAGSDVAGPMGREFVPFGKQSEAGEFMRDHRGAAVLRFKDLPGHPLE